MAQTDKHPFVTGRIAGGRYAAASSHAPYFFLVGETREEAESLAKRALDFYFEASGHIVKKPAEPTRQGSTTTKFRPEPEAV